MDKKNASAAKLVIKESSQMDKIDSSGVSDIGRVREENQDAYWLPDGDGQPRLYAIADGMGGHAHGAIASALALEKFYETFVSQRPPSGLKALRKGIESANLSVFQAAQRLGVGRMGTTITAVQVSGDQLYLAHVGDSRAYLVRNGQAICLTNDHTTVGDLVRMRVLSPDKVRTHAQRSILTRGVGLSLFVQPDLMKITLQDDDRLILCSDGVWSVIQDEEFSGLASEADSMHHLSQRLIDLAVERESDDNVSAVVIHVHLTMEDVPQSSKKVKQNSFGFFQRLWS
jgi:serine/threonine protein phosphatase PrpC